MTPIDVTAAIIEEKGRILIAQRKQDSHMGGKWEFPGGKIESGETPQACLKRELKEELGVDCIVGDFFCESTFDYGDRIIHLMTYKAQILSGTPVANVHAQLTWVKAADLSKYPMPEADKPIVEKLLSAQ